KPVPVVADKKDKSINAAFDDDPNDDGNTADFNLSVTLPSFPGAAFEEALKGDAADACTTPDAMRAYDSDMEATLVHELAHYQHLHGTCLSSKMDPATGKRMSNFDNINKNFLTIRYMQNYKALISDPEWKTLKKKIRGLEKLKDPSDAQSQEICDLHAERDALLHRHGILTRFPNDYHAVEEGDGVEYWAMAIETLVRQPETFCKYFSQEEMAWIKDNFGDCISQMSSRAPCYEEVPARRGAPAGARPGSEFLHP
ncbi:MAG TPA: hypothetical protein VMV18_02435, partial [bacterium]|nr:hypothetical protein [bacterium]